MSFFHYFIFYFRKVFVYLYQQKEIIMINMKHALIFDGTTYYVTSAEEAKELLLNDEIEEIIKCGNNLDSLDEEAGNLNEEAYD